MKAKTNGANARTLFFRQKVFKKALAVFSAVLVSGSIEAQNTSYNQDMIPITGSNNTGFGNFVLLSNTTGIYNSATGYRSLYSNTSGNYNTATGYSSLLNNQTGVNNVGYGIYTLISNYTGSGNSAFGSEADVGSSNLVNATAIGFRAVVNNNNAIQLGNINVKQVFAGIGTNATLITGGLQVLGGSPGIGKVLTSDAVGVATWQTPAANGWGLLGNAGTVDGTNFLGTTDNVQLNFRVNNQKAGRIDHINGNTFLGYNAAASNTGGGNTVFGGTAFLTNVSGNLNTIIGYGSDVAASNLFNSSALGYGAIVTTNNAIQLGNNNVTQVFAGTGTNATVIAGGLKVTGGTPAVGKVLTSDAVGVATWQLPGTAGWGLLGNAGTVDGTNFIGTTDNIPFTIRVNNIKAGRIDHLIGNTFLGYQSGINTTGSFNTAEGMNALSVNTTGSNNTALGYGANVSVNNLTNATAIGSGAIATANNAVQLGNSSVTQVFAGTGTNATVISGGLQMTGGSPGAGKVLTSDAVGVGTWQSLGSIVSSGWQLTGNAGTVPGTDFIGTTDGAALNFRVANLPSGLLSPNPIIGNTSFGFQADQISNGIHNTSFGCQALLNSAGARDNSTFGYNCMSNGSTAAYNSAYGAFAMQSVSSGSYNCAFGNSALGGVFGGNYNTGIGIGALFTSSADYNTGIGYQANVSTSGLTNATTLGSNAIVNASNKIRFGNTSITVIEGQVAYSYPSDGRFKNNLDEDDIKGLEFIKQLRPVMYNFDTKKFEDFLTKNMPDSLRKKYLEQDFSKSTAVRHSGFIAQEVEKAAQASGYNFDGLHKPDDDNDNYSLAYSQFVVPLVKGMQEQQKMIEDLQKQLEEQKQVTTSMQNKTASVTGIEQLNANMLGFSMSQNEPNPFTHETIVKYTLPQQVNSAYMAVYDLTGKQLTSFQLHDKGASSIVITSEKLAAGIYIYSIVGDGKILDSKRMVVAAQ